MKLKEVLPTFIYIKKKLFYKFVFFLRINRVINLFMRS